MEAHASLLVLGGSLDGLSLGALSESVLGLSGNMFQMSHSAGAGGSSSNRLLRPVVCTMSGSSTYISAASCRGGLNERIVSFVCSSSEYL